MASDSSGGFSKTIDVVVKIVGVLIVIFGFVGLVLFQASLVQILAYVITAALILGLLFFFFLKNPSNIKSPTGEKGGSPGSEALAFSLPIYSRAVRPSITPEFREILNKNRKNQISEIKQQLSGGKRGLIITGVKGVGKSTLAAYFAEGDDFWLDFIGKTIDLKTLLIILAQWAGEKGFEGHLQQCAKVGENEINHLCDKLTGFNRKLFFDNLETLLDKKTRKFKDSGVSLFFRKLLTTDHPCRIVVTSRIMPVLDEGGELEDEEGVVKVKSGGLSDKDGAELLREGGLEETEESPLESISREVDGNPLLLKQLIPILRRPSVGGSLDKLKQWKEKYKGEILQAILMEEAPKAGRELIFRMSVVTDPMTIEQVRVLREGVDTDNVVDDLESRSLLEWDEKRKLFSLHPAVKETAVGKLETIPKQLKTARKSAVNMYLVLAEGIKPAAQWSSIGDCIPILRIAELKIDIGDFEEALIATMILDDSLRRWGHWHLLANLYEGLLYVWNRKPSRSKILLKMYSGILNNYGPLKRSLGNFAGAINLNSIQLEISINIGDHLSECHAYGNLGTAEGELGNYTKAIEYHERCLKVAQEINYRQGEAWAYGNLGIIYEYLRDFKKAIIMHNNSLEIDSELEDKNGIAKDFGNLGNVCFALGNYDKAIEYHINVLVMAQESDDRHGEGIACSGLGNAYYSLGDYSKAIEYHEKSLEIALEIGDRPGEGAAYCNLGNAYQSLGEYRTAIEYQEKRLEIAQDIGDRRGEGNAYGNLCIAYKSLGEYDKAIEYQEKCLEIAQEIGDRRGEGNAYNGLGSVYSKLDEHEKALEYHRKALGIQEDIGDALGKAISFGNISVELLFIGNYAEAASNAVQGLLIATEIGVPQVVTLASITMECREKLGVEEFRSVVVKTVGEEKAGEVERILAEFEKRVQSAEGEGSDG